MDPKTVEQVTRRWVEEAVIGLNLCPFARSVYVEGRVRIVVSAARHLDAFLEDLDRELDTLSDADPAKIDTTLLVHPTLFPDFETFNDVLELAEEVVDEHALTGVIQVAHFHPDFRFEDAEEDDVANCSNRSPYPTLHLLREASIERAVSALADPDAIYRANIETLHKLGWAGWRALGVGAPDDADKP
ncbi:DUF1415 domain-containing protein [Crenobacter caeni]|uniref:DUF1415 domain-containing protein n=1 Tax=Crenobacter caeni TaxID=2705474 RepID=A0A6B2KMZ4_9NEIS|nr:DUF1415 domain-containing protein [Crenobacter caeni]NDV11602.1 DUF1415 domain-containing protein [Crenobacter caeni]